ncbi:MAG: DUF3021 domain-containing protein [Eubacteriales bacterium]|nr:DUF3021 domain-containing protein [Eubacteriales bacterium]
MKQYVKDFFIRGALFAWLGPVIMAIVWLCLQRAGVMDNLTVNQAVLGIFSITFMAFIAAGISVVYQIETLPKAFAALIQMAVLYIDYLGIYLLNGWLPVKRILTFSVIFVVGFLIIWGIIYLSVRIKVKKMNQAIR